MNRKMVSLSANERNTIEIIEKELKSLKQIKECFEEDNELLFETNNMLIKELRDSKEKYNELYEDYLTRIEECNKLFGQVMDLKQEIRRLKNPKSCGMCITCIECKQAIPEEELAIEKSIADSEAYYNRTWNLACGDDF